MRALSYIRVSSDEQAFGVSPDAQAAKNRAYAELYDLQIVDQIADLGVSGGIAIARRKGGAELARRLACHDADAVIVTDLDRLVRDTFEGLSFFRWCADHDIAVHSVQDRIDTSTPEGELTLTIKLAAATYERRKTGQRTRGAMAHLREQGRTTGGAVPFGLVARPVLDEQGRARLSGKGRPMQLLLRDPATWPVRERIVAMYRRGGDGATRFGYRQLAKRLNAEGIRAVGGGKHWSLAVLRNLVVHHDRFASLPIADAAQSAPDAIPTPDTEDSCTPV
jgi:DNA invertase Pin-like site-specific DNA recombinase